MTPRPDARPGRQRPPYGWRLAPGGLVADAVEQLVIARMRAWASDGLSHGRIARRLNSERTQGRDRWSTSRAVTGVNET